MRRIIATAALITATLTTGYAAGATSSATGQTTDHADAVHGRDIPAWVIRPCATPHDVNCRWNARTQAGGHGHTFIVRQFPGRAHMVCVMYAGRRYAATHDYCTATR